jgi:hypothetical protein
MDTYTKNHLALIEHGSMYSNSIFPRPSRDRLDIDDRIAVAGFGLNAALCFTNAAFLATTRPIFAATSIVTALGTALTARFAWRDGYKPGLT